MSDHLTNLNLKNLLKNATELNSLTQRTMDEFKRYSLDRNHRENEMNKQKFEIFRNFVLGMDRVADN